MLFFQWQMWNLWNLHAPKAFFIRLLTYHHVCFYLCLFFPSLTRVVLFKHVQGINMCILCTSSSVTIVVCVEIICLTGDCSKTPGDLWQTRFPAADWRLSQRSGICQSCEQHPGHGRTCCPDPSAPPVAACVLNRSGGKHWWAKIRPVCCLVQHQESRFNIWTLISSRRTTCCK